MTSADVDQALIEAPAQILRREISDMLRYHSANLPRSQQQAIGPSEMGHPCPRRVAQQAIRAPQCNRHAGDPLPSLVGTAAHSLMEDALRTYNARHGERYLIERKVYPIENLGGTMDCFDLETGTVIDWKFPGATSLTRVRRSGDPGEQYRAQAHLYGLGAVRAGFKVNAVAVMFFPRGGMLGGHNGAHVWHEDYDEQHAIDVIERYHSLILMTDDLDIDHHPERLALLPKTPHMCEYCPFYSPTPQDPYQCQGDTMSRHRIEDGGNSPADIIKRIERARRADSTREGIASAYRRLDEALTKATDKMCEIGLLPASTAPARASPAPWNQALNEARARARGGHYYP